MRRLYIRETKRTVCSQCCYILTKIIIWRPFCRAWEDLVTVIQGSSLTCIWICRVPSMFYLVVRVSQDGSLPSSSAPTFSWVPARPQISEFGQQHLHYISKFTKEQNMTFHIYDALIIASLLSTPAVLSFDLHPWAGLHCVGSPFWLVGVPRLPLWWQYTSNKPRAFTRWVLCLISEGSTPAFLLVTSIYYNCPECTLYLHYLLCLNSCTSAGWELCVVDCISQGEESLALWGKEALPFSSLTAYLKNKYMYLSVNTTSLSSLFFLPTKGRWEV